MMSPPRIESLPLVGPLPAAYVSGNAIGHAMSNLAEASVERHVSVTIDLPSALSARLFDEVIDPALEQGSKESLHAFIVGKWVEFHRLLGALEALAPPIQAEGLPTFEEALQRLGRPEIEETAQFATETLRNAQALVQHFEGGAARDAAADQDAAGVFNRSNELFVFSQVALGTAALGKKRVAEPVLLALAEILRESALEAYAAAREGYALRFEVGDEVSAQTEAAPVPFDEEDWRLATQ